MASMSSASLARKRELAHERPGRRVVAAAIELACKVILDLARVGEHGLAQRRQRALVRVCQRLACLFATLELSLEKVERQLRVRLADRVHAVQQKQVLRALHGILERAVRLVDAGGSLQRKALVGIVGTGESIRMNLGLQGAIRGVERGRVHAIAHGESEEVEMVAGEVEHFRILPRGRALHG
jgi:hypothetical protein